MTTDQNEKISERKSSPPPPTGNWSWWRWRCVGDRAGDSVKLFMRDQGRAMVPMVVVKYGKHLQSLESQGGIHMKPIRSVFSSLMYSMKPKFNIPLAS